LYLNIVPKKLLYDYKIYNFVFLENLETFIKNTISIDDDIYFLPNIFSQTNTYRVSVNISGNVYVYIHEKILIIPAYLIIFFTEKYLVLDYNLKLINYQLRSQYEEFKSRKKKYFLNKDLFILLNHKKVHNVNTLSGYVCALIIYYNKYISINQLELLGSIINIRNIIQYIEFIDTNLKKPEFSIHKINYIDFVIDFLYWNENDMYKVFEKLIITKLSFPSLYYEKLDEKSEKDSEDKSEGDLDDDSEESDSETDDEGTREWSKKYLSNNKLNMNYLYLKYKSKYITLKNKLSNK
jgi:hypothetical protein